MNVQCVWEQQVRGVTKLCDDEELSLDRTVPAKRAYRATPWMAIVLCLCTASLWATDRENYNGKWWLSLNQFQRLSFMDGYKLCYQKMVSAREFDEDIHLYRDRINTYLKEHPESAGDTLGELLWRLAHPPYSRPLAKHPSGGETYSGRWGFYNGGDYWQLGDDEDHLAFVQGFLDCYGKHTSHPNGIFSKSRESYVKAIDSWYGSGAAAVKGHENDGIPDVLFRFHD
jgi:hypothetical protein